MIPASLSGETWQDAEPFLTVFASNPNILAASAFTPNPGGAASTTAPIYVAGQSVQAYTALHRLDVLSKQDAQHVRTLMRGP
jgi:hypothetical protein